MTLIGTSVPLISAAPCSQFSDYKASLRRAGDHPWVLDRASHQPAKVVGLVTSLLLAGGGDLGPSNYGEPSHLALAEDGRNAYEIELLQCALEVEIGRLSMLARLLRDRLSSTDSYEVNSRHYQAMKSLGTGLPATATTANRVIEAVEDPHSRFCVGVQWHPENFR